MSDTAELILVIACAVGLVVIIAGGYFLYVNVKAAKDYNDERGYNDHKRDSGQS